MSSKEKIALAATAVLMAFFVGMLYMVWRVEQPVEQSPEWYVENDFNRGER